MRNNSIFDLTLILLVLLIATLGCLGPSKSGAQCEGVVTSNGKTFIGQSDSKKQAGLNACNKFCVEEDGEFQGMFQIWKATDKAKAFEKTHKRIPTKEDAVIEDEKILNYVTKKCAVKCVQLANRGDHDLETSCK